MEEVPSSSRYRGSDYYRSGRVTSLHVQNGMLNATVRGSSDQHYGVVIDLNDQGDINVASGTCDCLAYWEYGSPCKHIVAVAYAAQDRLRILGKAKEGTKAKAGFAWDGASPYQEGFAPSSSTKARNSDREAVDLLKRRAWQMVLETGHHEEPLGVVNLEPVLQESVDYYGDREWKLSFKVGREKLYVVMNIMEFKDAVLKSGYIDLGKSHQQWANRAAFSAGSQPLLDFILKHYRIPRDYFYYYGGRKKDMDLDPATADAFFDILAGIAGNKADEGAPAGKADEGAPAGKANEGAPAGKANEGDPRLAEGTPDGQVDRTGNGSADKTGLKAQSKPKAKVKARAESKAGTEGKALPGTLKFNDPEVPGEASAARNRSSYKAAAKKKIRTLQVVPGIPPLDLRLEHDREGAILRCAQPYRIIEGLERIHVILGDVVYSCSEEFSAQCRDILLTLEAARKPYELFFGKKDLPSVFSTLVPEVANHVEVKVAQGLDEFVPASLDTKVYLDVDEEGNLLAHMTFSYAGKTHDAFEEKEPSRSFDLLGEYRAEQVLLRYMDFLPYRKGSAIIFAHDEDRIFELAFRGIGELSGIAELFISDELKKLKVRPSAVVSVGVQVKDNLLEIDFDIGEAEIEDMAEVLKAYRKAKHYIRLKDGSFLPIAEGPLSQFAELALGLDLSEGELKEGHASLSLNHALYIDSLLKQNEELRYQRDERFRGIVRSLRDVADTDFPAPSSLAPILRNYQAVGFQWLSTLDALRFGGILADDMGLGKTLQVLALLLASKEGGTLRPSLVVCPASLVLNWKDEAQRFTPQLKVAALIGNGQERQRLLGEGDGIDLLVTSYDQLKRDIKHYDALDFNFIVLDEAQMIKNQNTQNAKAVKLLKGRTRLALTGTPVENNLAELWSVFDFLMPGYLRSYGHFRKRYELPIVKDRDAKTIERLRSLVRPFILRRLKSEVAKELPEKIEQVLKVAMGHTQEKLYRSTLVASREELALALAGSAGGQGHIEVLAALTRLRQICCDPSLVFDGYHEGSAKLEACLELVENSHESGHRMLLFSQFTRMLDIIGDELEKRAIGFCRLDGSTSKLQRQAMVHDFNTGDVPVFLISLKAGGTGLNLTGADVVIHYDPWWNISAQNQATDRTHRIGQTKKVQVFKLIVEGSIEERILRMQERKHEIASMIIQEGGNAFESMTGEEMLALLEDG
jgi:superfamily II DNA or RNA helicase